MALAREITDMTGNGVQKVTKAEMNVAMVRAGLPGISAGPIEREILARRNADQQVAIISQNLNLPKLDIEKNPFSKNSGSGNSII